MNFIGIIILVAIIGDLLLNALADYLNLSVLSDRIPNAFQHLYDPEKYQKSQEYLKVNTRFDWVVTVISTSVVLIFWFGKGFQILDQWVRSFSLGPVWTGLLYMGILILLKSLISLPFRIYSTFIIEEHFGFNKTTWSTFVMDIIKSVILGLIIGIPLIAGILFFFQYTGENAWLYCWIAVTFFMLVIQFIAPTWIMPLFNKFTPIEEGDLKNTIIQYAQSIHFPLENIYVMDGSKRSSKSNAFFTGFGKHRRIVLFDTLINNHSTNELLAILAHEMGHFKKKHILKMMLIGIIQTGIVFYLMSFFISYKGLFDAFYMTQTSTYAGLIFFGMLYAPIDFFTGLFMQQYSRKNEYQADRFAVETTGNAGPLVDSLKKLSMDNLSNLTPHPFYVFLNYSHPPVLERIKAIS